MRLLGGKSKSKQQVAPEPLKSEHKTEERRKSVIDKRDEPGDDENDFASQDVSRILLNRTNMKKKGCFSCGTQIPSNALRCFSCHVDQPIDPLNVTEPITVIKDIKPYKIYRITIQDEDPDIPPFMSYIIKLKDRTIINTLSSYVKMSHSTKKTKLGKKQRATVRARALIISLPQIRAIFDSLPQQTRDFIEQEVEPMRKEMVDGIITCLKKRKIPSDGLWYLFEPGTAIYGNDAHGNKIGSLVKTSTYQPGFAGDSFSITGSIIKTDGECFYYDNYQFIIPGFTGMKHLDDLNVKALDKNTLHELDERGKKFAELGLGNHYKQFRGTMLRSIGMYTTKTRMTGRIMVDVKTYNRRHLSITTYQKNGSTAIQYSNSAVLTKLGEDERWMSYPILPAFSFSLKTWGEFAVRDIIPIEFDTEAFTRLVLPEKKKSLIHALVEDYRRNVQIINELENRAFEALDPSFKPKNEEPEEDNDDLSLFDTHGNSRLFTDIITGKGGGCIFLLHGSPGVGKTLTAEAVCEHLSIPLYMITVGELGTTPEALERNLQEILELSAIWGCGILLDEADIFLEKRSKKDILRNAMVGIFLRLLEYHNGVLFLTTNRLSCIDEAFSSRISVALHYSDLDENARRQIWATFLQATVSNSEALSKLDSCKLATYEMNGRQIRSCVRLSIARARIDNSPLTMEHLLDTIHLSVDFKTQFFDEKTARRTRRREMMQHNVQVKLPDPFVTEGMD